VTVVPAATVKDAGPNVKLSIFTSIAPGGLSPGRAASPFCAPAIKMNPATAVTAAAKIHKAVLLFRLLLRLLFIFFSFEN
jgi:hypothetical protein